MAEVSHQDLDEWLASSNEAGSLASRNSPVGPMACSGGCRVLALSLLRLDMGVSCSFFFVSTNNGPSSLSVVCLSLATRPAAFEVGWRICATKLTDLKHYSLRQIRNFQEPS